ncbi:sensor domain-containing phosphodiesterase [uncultured Stenotrophomonas sp.]|uniref:sensor domain-containing diguanylate cyclase n=1 Tax=uncultured Stenotrophomonas sp. TaxID=165438 RepID=UPI0028D2D1F6|nr:sensor domain-containing phosphodiesterase [uncultured Stenotrophomonas sp.]
MSPTVTEERLTALSSLQALDKAAGGSLDRLTELTAYTFAAPVAFVSMIEVDKQKLISRLGLPMAETNIRESICSHTIGSNQVMVVNDLTKDPRFLQNPLVIKPPHLRFYAGAPLISQNGIAIGALCIMDEKPREFSESDRRQLETLGQSVMHQLELRALSGRREPVSGLPNRHQFGIDYASLALRAPGKRLYAVLIDILDLPRANEAGQVLGMPPLEALIRRAGVRLKVALDGVADVYHVGVTRFAFLVDLPGPESVESLLAEIQKRMIRPLMAGAVPMSPMFHAGACAVDLSVDEANDVIRKILIGLHASIASQSLVRWYSKARDEDLRRGYRLAVDAERSLRQQDFHLVYQPRFHLSDLRARSAEVLIRWNHPRLGPVSPAEFIPVFERTALIGSVTAWVLENALEQLARWRRDGVELSLSINLSVKDIAKPDAAERILDLLGIKGLSPSDVEVEITEGEWLRADSLPGEQISALAAAGVRVAIDDFGNGYSNFGYLTELPIHTLKLDKSLIDNIAVDERALLKTQAIIRLAQDLGYATVAEGAETAEQVERLKALGCDEIQGYALARPMDPDLLITMLRDLPAFPWQSDAAR